tara:strand:+ start:22 stop:489 length:468 start_codon:yes stop_codon:yes gene_type:complete
MAHFAKIGINGKVLSVHPMNDPDLLNADGIEDELVGKQYLEQHSNWPAELWVQTSYNTFQNTHLLGGTPFRGNHACIGYTWDEDNEIFWPKQPYPSWVKDTSIADWQSPIGAPPALTEEQEQQNTPPDENTPATHSWVYAWNEENQSWNLTDEAA